MDSVSLDSKHSQSLDSVSYSNHLDSKNLDSVSNLSDSNSLDSINLHSIDSATLSLLFMPIDDIQDKLFETNTCEFLPKIYGIYKNVEEIDFTHLPQSFVLKTNHDCGGVVLVQDKDEFLNNKKVFQESMDKLKKHLNTNYYTKTREWHYDNIEPRVFVEEMLCEVKGGKWKVPENYRLFCFRENIFIQIDDANYSNTHKRWFYDDKWNFQVFSYNMPVRTDEIPKPATLEGMINIAKYLSNSIDFVRVDLYTIGTKIIAGELTLTPVGGTGKFTPKIWDKKLGDLWKIKA
ncbi:putative glycosyltransferase [Helicobacter fennelliae]|nr:putative glycosyltransferase [Helicobacter fennelliae]